MFALFAPKSKCPFVDLIDLDVDIMRAKTIKLIFHYVEGIVNSFTEFCMLFILMGYVAKM